MRWQLRHGSEYPYLDAFWGDGQQFIDHMLQQHSIFQVFRTSKYYFYFSVLQLTLTLVLLTLLALSPRSGPHLILESLIAILLLADIVLKLLTDRHFLAKWRNIVDVAILTALLLLLLVELYSQSQLGLAEEISGFVLIARYGLQLYRIGSLVWQSKEAGLLNRLQEIRLDEFQVSDQIDSYRGERKEPKAH